MDMIKWIIIISTIIVFSYIYVAMSVIHDIRGTKMIKFKNLWLGFKEQLPLKRAFRNFFITGNAWGLFSKNSHWRGDTGKEKVSYSEKSAHKAAKRMGEKYDTHFSVYKCIYCDGYHIGKNRKNK